MNDTSAKSPGCIFFFKDMYRMNKCAVVFFPQRFKEVPSTTRPGNTAVHPDNLRFWTANQQSAQRKAPVASQPHCSVALEIKTSDSRGCNTPQLRNMWHRRICPQPMTFLRSWRTLRGNCRTQSSRDCTARVYKAHRSIHCENMMETAAGV